MLYVAGSIQPRALDSKLPLSAVFPLFSLSPQASPRCYLPIVPPSRSCPQLRFSATTLSSSSFLLLLLLPPPRHPPPPPPLPPLAVHPAAVLPLGLDTTSPTTTTRVFLLSVLPVLHKCRESRGTRGVRGYRWNELRIHFPKPVTLKAQIPRLRPQETRPKTSSFLLAYFWYAITRPWAFTISPAFHHPAHLMTLYAVALYRTIRPGKAKANQTALLYFRANNKQPYQRLRSNERGPN